MINRPRVLLTRRLTEDVEAALASDFDADLNDGPEAVNRQMLLSRASQFDALCPTAADPIDAELIEKVSGRVKIIANFGVGYNNIDIEAAREAGIVVTNTPGVVTEATADLVMTLLLMAARRAGEGDRLCRSGNWTGWQPTQMLGTDVAGKTLGLVGFGRIGQAVAQRAHHGFGMKILIYSRSASAPALLTRYGAVQYYALDELLAQSDFVSLHCPSTPATHHLINAEKLSQMKASAILVNTARGDIVDESALVSALQQRTIAGAALDVYEREPVIEPELRDLDNVVLLPHLGSATENTRSAMGMRMLKNLHAFFSGETPPDRVA